MPQSADGGSFAARTSRLATENDGDEAEWKTVQGRGTRGRNRWNGGVGTIGSIDRGGGELEVNQIEHGWERIRVQVDSGAIDTVAPKGVAKAFSIKETTMSRRGIGFVAANGTKICNYGERAVAGYTDGGEAVSMRMTCADVQKVLGSVHRMNMGGNRVVLDGDESYMENRKSGKRTPIKYENGQYALYLWVPATGAKVAKNVGGENRYAILAAEDEPAGFARPVTRA